MVICYIYYYYFNKNHIARNELTSQRKLMSIFTKRCIPFSALNSRLADANGEAIFSAEPMLDTFDTLEWAASNNIIESTSIWDDDLLPWAPDNRSRILDKQDQMTLDELQEFFGNSKLSLTAFGCDLARNAIFRNGALTNPSDSIRNLALRKLERAIYIAKALGADTFRLFIGREGFEELTSVKWQDALKKLADGLNFVTSNIGRGNIKYTSLLAGYSRRLRGNMFITSAEQAAFMVSQLNRPENWKICIEGIVPPSVIALLGATDAMAFMPFSASSDNLPMTSQCIDVLESIGWQGVAECQGSISRADADMDDRELTKRLFITNSIIALQIATELAAKKRNATQDALSSNEAALLHLAASAEIKVDELLKKVVAEHETPQQPAQNPVQNTEKQENRQQQKPRKGKPQPQYRREKTPQNDTDTPKDIPTEENSEPIQSQTVQMESSPAEKMPAEPAAVEHVDPVAVEHVEPAAAEHAEPAAVEHVEPAAPVEQLTDEPVKAEAPEEFVTNEPIQQEITDTIETSEIPETEEVSETTSTKNKNFGKRRHVKFKNKRRKR